MTTPVRPPLDIAHLDHRQVARLLAAIRIVAGAALVIAPRTIGIRWVGDDAARAGTRLFIRTMGIRDLALAVGTMRALNHRGPAREWVLASATSDAVDVVATVLAMPSIGVRRGLPSAITALLASAAGFAAAGRVD
jgi:hypothetical protein